MTDVNHNNRNLSTPAVLLNFCYCNCKAYSRGGSEPPLCWWLSSSCYLLYATTLCVPVRVIQKLNHISPPLAKLA